ncbi:MAG: efflux RND transporter periplasmic adaptor subunit [Gammaproteobacteria bacterium]|nr:efflux RND transporter periplasmic adaptor subunit [Gammaproteobacteria bacterium]
MNEARSCARQCAVLIAGLALATLAGAAPTTLVSTVPVVRHVMYETIVVYGRVQPDPDQLTSITVPRAGIVTRLWVRLGQRVGAGDALLELDTAPTARMDYQQASAAVEFARNDLARLRTLLEDQLATRDQVASAERSLSDAEAAFEAQRKLGTGVASEVIRAPFTGVVTQLGVSQGQRVQADSAALLLASGRALLVPLGVEAEDIGRVRVDMPVVLSSVLQPDIRIDAAVNAVHAMVNPATRLVDVIVRVPAAATPALVLDSMMEGRITLSDRQALAVPRSAVLRGSGGAYVFMVRDGKAHRVAVVSGIEQDDLIAIDGDIAAGDAVVTRGNYELVDGAVVRESAP